MGAREAGPVAMTPPGRSGPINPPGGKMFPLPGGSGETTGGRRGLTTGLLKDTKGFTVPGATLGPGGGVGGPARRGEVPPAGRAPVTKPLRPGYRN